MTNTIKGWLDRAAGCIERGDLPGSVANYQRVIDECARRRDFLKKQIFAAKQNTRHMAER